MEMPLKLDQLGKVTDSSSDSETRLAPVKFEAPDSDDGKAQGQIKQSDYTPTHTYKRAKGGIKIISQSTAFG